MSEQTDFSRLSQKQIAAVFGVTPRAVRDWDDAGFPRNADGTYDAPACVQWYCRREAGPDALDLEQERARLAREQADRVAMDNAVRRGELLDKAMLGADLERALVAFRERMRGAATKLAPRVNPEKPHIARDIIAAELDRILAELAAHFADAAQAELRAADGREGGDPETATPTDGESVGGQVSPAQQRNKRRARTVEH